MTTARNRQIDLDVTPYYHCTTSCVRRSFLCGYDHESKRNFDHRKLWIESLLLTLSSSFCIDIAAYAIMSNHYHVVLKVNKTEADVLSDLDVAKRWLLVFKGNELAKRYCDGEKFSKSEKKLLRKKIKHWRCELTNISRFMGQINEKIARWANKEDECKGRFWEARFDSQAVLDLQALVQTMIYVDLNPLRAKISDTPEESKFTSIHRRLNRTKHGLLAFRSEEPSNPHTKDDTIPFTFKEYLLLLDWSGREIRSGKRGTIDANTPPILERLNLSPERWLDSMVKHTSWRQKAIGSKEHIKAYCKAMSQKWIWQYSESVL